MTQPASTTACVASFRVALTALLPLVCTVPSLAQGERACARDNTWLFDIMGGIPPCNVPGVSPLAGFRLGDPEATWRAHLDRLERASVLNQEGEGSYRYDLTHGDTDLPLVLRLNPGDYTHGPLRVVELECPPRRLLHEGGMELTLNACTPREAEGILSHMLLLHGRPLEEETRVGFQWSEAPPDTAYTWTWGSPSYTAELLVRANAFPEWRITGVSDAGDAGAHKSVLIRYEASNAAAMEAPIREDIRGRLRARDLLRISVAPPSFRSTTPSASNGWSDGEVAVRVWSFDREGLEEPRGIVGVEFDLVVVSASGEELCRVDRCSYELSPPLQGRREGAFMINTGKGFLDGAGPTYRLGYSSSTPAGRDCARAARATEPLHVRAEVMRVRFEDGEVRGN